MLVSINQPAYLPWLGYFHRIAVSDLHIVLDHVQFEKNSFINRNKLRTSQGSCWLSIPLKTKNRFNNLPINELKIADDLTWARKHWETMRLNYRRAPFFSEHVDFFEETFATSWQKLLPLQKHITGYILQNLHIDTPIIYSSELGVYGKKDELVLDLCRKVGATRYLSGPLGRNYLKEDIFDQAGISLRYQDYNHPHYSQAYEGFEPFMAVVDLLFNHGADSLGILMSGNADQQELEN